MISADKLKNVKKLVTHKNCADGTSSALIIKDVLPDIEVLFAGYKDDEYLNLNAEDGLLFCDISPPTGREEEFLESKSIVLDHHIKTKEVVERFQKEGLGVYGDIDEGVAGATLAYRHVWKLFESEAKNTRQDVCRLARLAAIRDTWQVDDMGWLDAVVQSETLFFFGPDYLLDKDRDFILTPEEIKIGKLIVDKNEKRVSSAIKNTLIFEWNNLKVGVLSGMGSISDAAEELRKDGVNLTIGFYYKLNNGNPEMICSLRSDGSFDCNAFAQKHGGGGHRRAAGGLTVRLSDRSENPFSLIQRLVKGQGSSCII